MLRWIAIAALLVQASCATGLFSDGPSKSREDAIAACVESVPAETVPYADAFAACMESYGWVHQ